MARENQVSRLRFSACDTKLAIYLTSSREFKIKKIR
jgi:hypothetical protein